MKILLPALLIAPILTFTGCSSSHEPEPTASTPIKQEYLLTDTNMNTILKLDDPQHKLTLSQVDKIASEPSLFFVNKQSGFAMTKSEMTNVKFMDQQHERGKSGILVIDRKNNRIYCTNDNHDKLRQSDLVSFAITGGL